MTAKYPCDLKKKDHKLACHQFNRGKKCTIWSASPSVNEEVKGVEKHRVSKNFNVRLIMQVNAKCSR